MITLQLHWLAIVFGLLVAFLTGAAASYYAFYWALRRDHYVSPTPKCIRCGLELYADRMTTHAVIPKGACALLCCGCEGFAVGGGNILIGEMDELVEIESALALASALDEPRSSGAVMQAVLENLVRRRRVRIDEDDPEQ